MKRWAALFLSASVLLLLAHAFIPIHQFIHRNDDAYYYFKLAANYPQMGFWSFDRIHSTNGVQPLWAVMLTAIAQLLSWFSITDLAVLVRVFVACSALLHFASGLMLFHLLSMTVSTGTGLAAAGAFLFPMGIVWARVSGMENSLYALMLVSSVSYLHLRFLPRATTCRAFVLGILLGLTALARLNAAILIPCVLLYLLCAPTAHSLAQRLRLVAVTGGAAAMLLLPYLLANYLVTGHLLPVSGAVKAVLTDQFLEARQVRRLLSSATLTMIHNDMAAHLWRFMASRVGDGFWAAGSRLLFTERIPLVYLLLMALAVIGLPLCVGQPREWLTYLGSRLRRLAVFWYVLLFGVVDATVSMLLYPNQVRYAMTGWWFVNNEIIIVVTVATLTAAAVSYIAVSLLPKRLHARLLAAVLAVSFLFHGQQMVRFYWSDAVVHTDWKTSWNDELFLAARWLSENVPPDATVGAWNAGILGYYATQRVVNLDGLINNFELLPYLRERRISDYIRRKRIAYLSDLDPRASRAAGSTRRPRARGLCVSTARRPARAPLR
ncbi:MAG: hypothetical protein ACRENW_02670, partial [Thermodesulfobacteriota bacterium]